MPADFDPGNDFNFQSETMSKLIFFVDDDKMILNLLEYTFQSRGQYDVKSFPTGEECLTQLDQQPDLIVLDHCLDTSGEKKLNGMQTLEKIKTEQPEIPVIVLSGCGSEELFSEFKSKGAAECFTKDDYFIDVLISKIGEML